MLQLSWASAPITSTTHVAVRVVTERPIKGKAPNDCNAKGFKRINFILEKPDYVNCSLALSDIQGKTILFLLILPTLFLYC